MMGNKCFGCDIFGHSVLNCPKLHHVRNKYLVVNKLNFTQN
jgi:hypothetical protein